MDDAAKFCSQLKMVPFDYTCVGPCLTPRVTQGNTSVGLLESAGNFSHCPSAEYKLSL